MPKSIIELRERQNELLSQAREKLDSITDDTDEARANEIEAEYDGFMTEYDRLEAQIKREEDLAAREERANTPVTPIPIPPNSEGGTGEGEQRTQEEIRSDAFAHYLRHGVADMPAELRAAFQEMRAQSTTDAAGGYTVPEGFSGELVKSLLAWGPMLDPGVTRQIVTATGNSIPWPTLNDTSNVGYRLAENTQASNEGDLVFGQKALDAYKYASGPILVSSELLQDSAFNVEMIIRDAMAERIGRVVNTDLTTGDGTGDPNGIVTASTLGATAAAAAAIGFDDLINLVHSVDPAYRRDPSCAFQLNDGSLKLLRKVKDGNSNYIWQPASARTGEPSTILDFPYYVNQAMPAATTGLKSVIFGALNKYIVRRVREIAVRRLVERYADYDQVGFIGFARYDGDLMDTAAVKHLIQA